MRNPRKVAGAVLFGDLRVVWLQAFVQASKSRKRMAAADELRVSNGDMTKYIAKLEQWLGRPLMIADTTILHPDGEAFLPVAEKMLELLREAHMRPVPVEVPRVSGADIQIP